MIKAQSSFSRIIWEYYKRHGRHSLPWRQVDADGDIDPYKVMVSELMLQQTQVNRVIPKFEEFILRFPSFEALAKAPIGEVLVAWSGLGYNRRAKFLWQAAGQVMHTFEGQLPMSQQALVTLPGIGRNTAGAILAYAFNKPSVFIETNIRTVFIHHFFSDAQVVADNELLAIIEDTLPKEAAREWYWALMDYGTHLKQTVGNLSRASAGYTKQSPFAGSRRQVRGKVLRTLIEKPYSFSELTACIADDRLESVLIDLQSEGFIEHIPPNYQLRA